MPSNFKALAGASGGEPTDANFKNVTLLLHGDGSNGAQNNTFLDSSTNNFTITRNGNTTQGSFSPYGSNWSNYFDGTGDYINAGSQTAYALGTGSFTVEAWVYPTASTGTFASILDTRSSDNSNTGWDLGFSNNTAFVYSSSFILTSAANTVPYNTWTHIAFVRSGSSIALYINGTLAATGTNSNNFTDSTLYVGANPFAAAQNFLGYISNARVVKGTAVYTSNFTPSTTPLTAITNTSLLTCQSNRFRDASTNNFTITRNGDVKVTNFAPFAPSAAYSKTTNGGSSYYDGDTDYLSTSDNAAFVLNGTFTLEAWVYPTGDYSKYQCIITKRAGNTPAAWQLYINITDGYLGYYNGSGYNSTAQVPLNQWSHVAGVYDGTNINLYLNGVRVLQSATTNTDQSTGVKVGYHFSSVAEPFKGYLADVRVVKGSQVYSGTTYTVPTAPLTAITNTSLLLNATNAAIFDNSMKNDLETVGNAQISTSVKKFGTGSMYFDGTGDYLFLPSIPELYFSTGDFTIEAWIYPTGGSGNRAIFSGGITNAFAFYINSTGKIAVAKSGVAEIIASTTTISTSTFTHVAATRSGNTFRIFVNGTLEATVTSSQDFTSFSDNRVGYESGSSYYQGYIDELRITKGYARYTANFTAPTAPFPNK